MLGAEGFGSYEVDWEESPLVFRRINRPPRCLLVPGFVDLHIHGGYGIDFMSASQADTRLLLDKLADDGYEALLPTTVTANAAAVSAFLAKLPEHPMIAGFHLEGPFISPVFPGAQRPDLIASVPVGPSDWDVVLDDPRLRIVTLAPEIPNALDLCLRLMKRRVIVSLGHTNATYEEARRGFEFGAAHATHTFNAMRPVHHREAGMVGYALNTDDLTCELIYDRLHVGRDAAELLLKVKPPHRLVAVSDATMALGMPAGQRILMWGMECITGRRDVRLVSNGALAGSASCLRHAFRNLAEDFGEETAIRLCCLNPRRALNLTGPPRVWLELDKEYRLIGRRVATEAA